MLMLAFRSNLNVPQYSLTELLAWLQTLGLVFTLSLSLLYLLKRKLFCVHLVTISQDLLKVEHKLILPIMYQGSNNFYENGSGRKPQRLIVCVNIPTLRLFTKFVYPLNLSLEQLVCLLKVMHVKLLPSEQPEVWPADSWLFSVKFIAPCTSVVIEYDLNLY